MLSFEEQTDGKFDELFGRKCRVLIEVISRKFLVETEEIHGKNSASAEIRGGRVSSGAVASVETSSIQTAMSTIKRTFGNEIVVCA
jgi:hypothetical protein